ncbi:MAG: SPFH domain-containing protein [Varibaculum sp.]|nr:SPFH domain-containing protein [Varibaculum sp.]
MNTPSTTPVGLEGVRTDVTEKTARHAPGIVALLLTIVTLFGATGLIGSFIVQEETGNQPTPLLIVLCVACFLVFFVSLTMMTVVQPGETRVMTFFGTYVGTIRKPGFFTVMPFTTRKKVNVRINNFETNQLKVNDLDGNPINIAAIVVWQVADTAKAAFAVENYEEFVHVQSEAALRHVASAHPYDNSSDGTPTLRGSMEQVAEELSTEVAARIILAGLEVVETRISTLAYAPEIAQAMLQRQQASAVIAAREQIVDGAVSMVQNALESLETQDVVVLDEERKAAMISNLLVVLCSDSQATPVVNAGTLYN